MESILVSTLEQKKSVFCNNELENIVSPRKVETCVESKHIVKERNEERNEERKTNWHTIFLFAMILISTVNFFLFKMRKLGNNALYGFKGIVRREHIYIALTPRWIFSLLP